MEDYAARSGVRSAQYQRPAHSIMGRRAPGHEEEGRDGTREGRGFKTERWRERGALRWPRQAGELIARQPCQFHRAEEVVPLQRAMDNTQESIPSEIWCRSLRTECLNIQDLGHHNGNLATSAANEMFDRGGRGWSGKTNSKRQGRPTPPMGDWVERPVAVGKMGLEHMGGSRYAMSLTPRQCVPGSMAHCRSPSAPSPGHAPKTAR